MKIVEHVNAEERRREIRREHDACDVENVFDEIAFPEPPQEHEEGEMVGWFFDGRKVLHSGHKPRGKETGESGDSDQEHETRCLKRSAIAEKKYTSPYRAENSSDADDPGSPPEIKAPFFCRKIIACEAPPYRADEATEDSKKSYQGNKEADPPGAGQEREKSDWEQTKRLARRADYKAAEPAASQVHSFRGP